MFPKSQFVYAYHVLSLSLQGLVWQNTIFFFLFFGHEMIACEHLFIPFDRNEMVDMEELFLGIF